MELTDLMNIQVGKRYRWGARLTEDVCPKCGRIAGDKRWPEIVTVVRASAGRYCPNCFATLTADGYYGCWTTQEHCPIAIPYTQLHRIEGEEYD